MESSGKAVITRRQRTFRRYSSHVGRYWKSMSEAIPALSINPGASDSGSRALSMPKCGSSGSTRWKFGCAYAMAASTDSN